MPKHFRPQIKVKEAVKSKGMRKEDNGTGFPKITSPLKRVTKRRKCEICGRPDWCSYTEDGALALCMRVSAGSVKQAKNGAYIHVLRSDVGNNASAVSTSSLKSSGSCGNKQADADHLHEVYTYLLGECLELTEEHGDILLNERTLSDTTIAYKLYASQPSKEKLPEVCAKLEKRFGNNLNGVPGFYKDEAGRWKMVHYNGYFIPVRDVQGRIVGMQIRLDGNVEHKYLWFSTSPEKFTCGASSGTPVHYVKPDLVKQFGFAFITEGALKADIISEYKHAAVIAIAGVTCFDEETFGIEVRKAIPKLERAVIAFDSDWKTNSAVKEGLLRMGRSLRAAGLIVEVLDWDAEQGKGLDNALIENERRVEENE
jgi:hypothetical protein